MNFRGNTTVLVVVGVLTIAWAIQHNLQAPPPKLCGSPGGPPISSASSRIKLKDGRHIAIKEFGVPLHKANYKIVFVHGFSSCRYDTSIYLPELFEELGVYMVGFDRPGYGESDPDPHRTIKSSALDIEDLADRLGLGPKFYLVGYSMGGHSAWGCLNYIPHRLAGVALISPVVNYWWSSFPRNLSREVFFHQKPQDQWAVGVAHYAPWLVYWWNTQKWFPRSSVVSGRPNLSPADMKVIFRVREHSSLPHMEYPRQQGDYESIYRDMKIGFGSWEFDPMQMKNPFQNNEASVHMWQGDDDVLVPVDLQRYIAGKLPWIKYHELSGVGHMLPFYDGMKESILKQLLLGDKSVDQ